MREDVKKQSVNAKVYPTHAHLSPQTPKAKKQEAITVIEIADGLTLNISRPEMVSKTNGKYINPVANYEVSSLRYFN